MKRALFVMVVLFGVCAPNVSFAATAEENKSILKNALVGAMTGTAAVLGSKEDAPAAASTSAVAAEEKEASKNFSGRKRHHHDDDDQGEDSDGGHHHKHKEKKRPHGWDMGKKTGWGDKDTPPGLAKKDT